MSDGVPGFKRERLARAGGEPPSLTLRARVGSGPGVVGFEGGGEGADEPRHADDGEEEEADGGDQADFAAAVGVKRAGLDVGGHWGEPLSLRGDWQTER